MTYHELPRLLTSEQFLALSPTKRLLAVKEHIQFAPEHHDQNSWTRFGQMRFGWCGTTACIAGWACFLAGKVDARGIPVKHLTVEFGDDAQHLLGLNADQRTRLFGCSTESALAVLDDVVAENSE